MHNQSINQRLPAKVLALTCTSSWSTSGLKSSPWGLDRPRLMLRGRAPPSPCSASHTSPVKNPEQPCYDVPSTHAPLLPLCKYEPSLSMR